MKKEAKSFKVAPIQEFPVAHHLEPVADHLDRAPHPEDDPVEDAYNAMVEATAKFYAVKQWQECKGNPDYVGPVAQYHSEWVRDQLSKDDGTDFMIGVADAIQRELQWKLDVECSARHYLKFFIVRRITQEHNTPKNNFSDVNFYTQELEEMRGPGDGTLRDKDDSERCVDIATRMAEIWEVEYKQEVDA